MSRYESTALQHIKTLSHVAQVLADHRETGANEEDLKVIAEWFYNTTVPITDLTEAEMILANWPRRVA